MLARHAPESWPGINRNTQRAAGVGHRYAHLVLTLENLICRVHRQKMDGEVWFGAIGSYQRTGHSRQGQRPQLHVDP